MPPWAPACATRAPERRFIRDYIDARWSVREVVLPIMTVVLALSFLRTN